MTTNSGKPLEMPKTPKRSSKYRYFIPFFILWLILAFGVVWWIWAQFGDITSSQAVLEGDVVPVVPEISAPVAEIFVTENQEVSYGQPLVRLQLSTSPQNKESGPEDPSKRAAEIRTREDAFVRRLISARQEENAAVREVEKLSMEHVKAQLEVRSLEALGASVPKDTYDRARQAELAARVRMEAARGQREEAARARASVEMELNRMRVEAQQSTAANGKSAASSQRQYSATPDASLVLAPSAGQVVGISTAGMMARRGASLMTIIPPGGSGLWVMAYFREKAAADIKPGQKCKVVIDGYEAYPMNGVVEDMIGHDSSGPRGDRQIAVRIRLKLDPEISRPALNLGMKASVIVHTRVQPVTYLREFTPDKILSKKVF